MWNIQRGMNRGVFSNKYSLHRMLFFLKKTLKIVYIPIVMSYYEKYNIKSRYDISEHEQWYTQILLLRLMKR